MKKRTLLIGGALLAVAALVLTYAAGRQAGPRPGPSVPHRGSPLSRAGPGRRRPADRSRPTAR